MDAYKILIIEDDKNSATVLSRILNKCGYITDSAADGESGLNRIAENEYDLLIIDMILPDIDGLTVLKNVKQLYPDVLIIIVTAYGSVDSAVEALKAGANDFLEKPLVPEKLLHVIRKAFEERQLRNEITALRSDLKRKYQFANIIGRHPKMQRIFHIIESVARLDSSVLITGETGTGKDLVARAIHFESQRKNRPFVAINCASIPETLLESELFGYERGAFTGAVKSKIGKLEQAQKGTVFLDEIGDMPMSVQGKLLRAIQDKKIERLGSADHTPISLSFRLISATNKDLSEEIGQNRFRLDLFYRINVVPITIPPLRERTEDIPLLVDYFLNKIVKKRHIPLPRLSEKAFSQLLSHHWPGNVRELENVIERSIILSRGEVVEDILFSNVNSNPTPYPQNTSLPFNPTLSLKELREDAMARLEETYLVYLLKKYNGSIKRTAAHADIDVRTVHRKMKDYGLDKWDYKSH